MELSGLGKISYAKQKQCKLPALVLCFRHSFAMNTVKASEYIYLNFCMLYVIHTKYMQCLNKLWGIIIKWTLVSVVPVLWGHSLHVFLQPSSLLTPEVASNFMHACFLIRGLSFTQHLTWELPPNYSGWFFVCLFVFGGGYGKMSFVLKCFQTRDECFQKAQTHSFPGRGASSCKWRANFQLTYEFQRCTYCDYKMWLGSLLFPVVV